MLPELAILVRANVLAAATVNILAKTTVLTSLFSDKMDLRIHGQPPTSMEASYVFLLLFF